MKLTGLTIADTMDRLIPMSSGYRWSVEGGILNVNSNQPLSGSICERRVQAFDVAGQGVMEAVAAVHRIFDPTYNINGSTIGSRIVSRRADTRAKLDAIEMSRRVDYEKPIHVALRRTTVREILNAIALAHGGITWEVAYRAAPASYDNSTITVRGFGGWVSSLHPRPRRSRSR
jgi:hypothetical protein